MVATATQSREQRATVLVETGGVRKTVGSGNEGIYQVRASSLTHWYKTDARGVGYCDCADHQRGGQGHQCKHVLAAKAHAVKCLLHEATGSGDRAGRNYIKADDDMALADACAFWCEWYGLEMATELSDLYRTAYRTSYETGAAWRVQQAAAMAAAEGW